MSKDDHAQIAYESALNIKGSNFNSRWLLGYEYRSDNLHGPFVEPPASKWGATWKITAPQYLGYPTPMRSGMVVAGDLS